MFLPSLSKYDVQNCVIVLLWDNFSKTYLHLFVFFFFFLHKVIFYLYSSQHMGSILSDNDVSVLHSVFQCKALVTCKNYPYWWYKCNAFCSSMWLSCGTQKKTPKRQGMGRAWVFIIIYDDNTKTIVFLKQNINILDIVRNIIRY